HIAGSDLGVIRARDERRAENAQAIAYRQNEPDLAGERWQCFTCCAWWGAGIDLVQQELFAILPQTEKQRWLRSNALEITNTLARSRWTTFEQIGSRFPWQFLIIVVFWLAIIFASFGLFAPRNASVTVALFIAALGLAGAVFMILEMEQPYQGGVRIPSTSMRIALDQLGGSCPIRSGG